MAGHGNLSNENRMPAQTRARPCEYTTGGDTQAAFAWPSMIRRGESRIEGMAAISGVSDVVPYRRESQKNEDQGTDALGKRQAPSNSGWHG